MLLFRRVFLFALLVVVPLVLALPHPATASDDWLPINPADLALADNPASPGSDAMILYREEKVNDAQHFESEYFRIKIFTAAGKKYADVEIPYRPGLESVSDIRARTIQPNGSVVEFSGNVYDKVVVRAGGVKVQEKAFSLSDVQPGSIIEYKYIEPFDPGAYFARTVWDVQRDLFTRDARFSFVPLADQYQSEAAGYFGWRTLGLPKDEAPQKQNDGTFVLEVHNVPAMAPEPYSVPQEMIESRVEFYYVDRANEPTAEFWKRTGKDWNKTLDSFVNKKSALEQALQPVVHPNDSPDMKLREIYARVQQVRNLSFEPSKTKEERKGEKIVPNKNVEDVLKHDYGTWEDINALFVGLARAAGFDATEVYVAPRDRTLFIPDYKDPSQLQVSIVDVKQGTQDLYLDPSSPEYPYGLLPWNEDAVHGMRLSKDGGEIVMIPAEDSTNARILRALNIRLQPDGSLAGTLIVDYLGQEAAVWRAADRNDDETGRKNDLHDEIKGWLPTGATFQITQLSNWSDNSKPLHVEGAVTFPALSTHTLGHIIMPVSLMGSPVEGAFTSPQRTNDVYFHFPFEEFDETTYQLPAGYHLESFPKITTIPKGAIQYVITGAADSGTVHISRKLDINAIDLPVKYYPSVQAVFNVVKTGDENDMVLAGSSF